MELKTELLWTGNKQLRTCCEKELLNLGMKNRLYMEDERIRAGDDCKTVAWTISHCYSVCYPACDRNHRTRTMYSYTYQGIDTLKHSIFSNFQLRASFTPSIFIVQYIYLQWHHSLSMETSPHPIEKQQTMDDPQMNSQATTTTVHKNDNT